MKKILTAPLTISEAGTGLMSNAPLKDQGYVRATGIFSLWQAAGFDFTRVFLSGNIISLPIPGELPLSFRGAEGDKSNYLGMIYATRTKWNSAYSRLRLDLEQYPYSRLSHTKNRITSIQFSVVNNLAHLDMKSWFRQSSFRGLYFIADTGKH